MSRGDEVCGHGRPHMTKTEKADLALNRNAARGLGLGRGGAGERGDGFVFEHQLPPDEVFQRQAAPGLGYRQPHAYLGEDDIVRTEDA